jgi:hypothetical protein
VVSTKSVTRLRPPNQAVCSKCCELAGRKQCHEQAASKHCEPVGSWHHNGPAAHLRRCYGEQRELVVQQQRREERVERTLGYLEDNCNQWASFYLRYSMYWSSKTTLKTQSVRFRLRPAASKREQIG